MTDEYQRISWWLEIVHSQATWLAHLLDRLDYSRENLLGEAWEDAWNATDYETRHLILDGNDRNLMTVPKWLFHDILFDQLETEMEDDGWAVDAPTLRAFCERLAAAWWTYQDDDLPLTLDHDELLLKNRL